MLFRGFETPAGKIEKSYEKYGSELYKFAVILLADVEAAEDVVQQVFTKILKLGKKVLEIDDLNSYLRKAVRNQCYEVIKKKSRQNKAIINITKQPFLVKVTEEKVGANEHENIEKAIRTLPLEQREVLHMKIYEDRTFEEIANVLEISINTVASRYRYAINKLRELLASDNKSNGRAQ